MFVYVLKYLKQIKIITHFVNCRTLAAWIQSQEGDRSVAEDVKSCRGHSIKTMETGDMFA